MRKAFFLLSLLLGLFTAACSTNAQPVVDQTVPDGLPASFLPGNLKGSLDTPLTLSEAGWTGTVSVVETDEHYEARLTATKDNDTASYTVDDKIAPDSMVGGKAYKLHVNPATKSWWIESK